MISKEDFFKLMIKTKKDTVINQFYYEHRSLMDLLNRIDKAIEYIEKIFYVKSGLSPKQATDLLNILKGEDK